MRPCPDLDHGPVLLGAQTAPPPRRPRDRMIRPGSVSNWTGSNPRSITTGTCRPRVFGGRSKFCGAVHLLARIFMPRLLRTKRANQLTTLAALQPQLVQGARQPEPQACKNYTAPSAEYRLHVNILSRPYKGD